MAANEAEVRAAARAELARRELERRRNAELPSLDDIQEVAPPPFAGSPATQGMLGGGEFLAQLLSGVVAEPLSGLAGIGGVVGGLVPGGESPSEKGARFVEGTSNALTFQPRTPHGQALSQGIGGALAPIEQGIDDAVATPTDTGGAFGINSQSFFNNNQEGQTNSPLGSTIAKTALLGIPGILGARGVTPTLRAAIDDARQSTAAIPTVDELFQQGGAAFKRADAAGVTVSADSITGFADNLAAKLAKEGIDRDLHPKSTAALRRVVEDAQSGSLSFESIQTLRKIAGDARSSIDAPDARLAGIIVREIDDYVDNLKPRDVTGGDPAVASAAVNEARGLWSRARKGEAIERLITRAETRAGQFTGSGFENALRTEFRSLAMNDRKFKLFNPEEQAAIRRVAQGGPIDNALRFLGKFAPRGVVSTGLSMGIGAGIGNQLFGDNLIGSLGLPMLGEAGRQAATQATIRNATKAAEIARDAN